MDRSLEVELGTSDRSRLSLPSSSRCGTTRSGGPRRTFRGRGVRARLPARTRRRAGRARGTAHAHDMSPDTSATCPPQAAGGPGGGGGDGREGPLSGLSLHREVVSELSLSQPEAATTAQLAEAVSAALEADARHAPLDAPRSRAYFLRGVRLDARRPPPQESPSRRSAPSGRRAARRCCGARRCAEARPHSRSSPPRGCTRSRAASAAAPRSSARRCAARCRRSLLRGPSRDPLGPF